MDYSYPISAFQAFAICLTTVRASKLGTGVFEVYPNGKTLVHFVCFRNSQSMKVVAKGTPLKQGNLKMSNEK